MQTALQCRSGDRNCARARKCCYGAAQSGAVNSFARMDSGLTIAVTCWLYTYCAFAKCSGVLKSMLAMHALMQSIAMPRIHCTEVWLTRT